MESATPTPEPEPRRRRWPRVLAATLVLLVIVFALGPTPEVDTTLRPTELPESPAELPDHLAQTEGRFDDITPGAEKTVVWANPERREQTPLALVYLHGYSATRQETAPLCDEVAKRLGANLYYTRLTGHGAAAPRWRRPPSTPG